MPSVCVVCCCKVLTTFIKVLVLTMYLYQRYCFSGGGATVNSACFCTMVLITVFVMLSKYINKHCCLMVTNITKRQTPLVLVSRGLC